MAVVGSRVSQQMRALQNVNNHSQHATLAAAQPFYHSNANTQVQETKPDRPIGYGAFGVVW